MEVTFQAQENNFYSQTHQDSLPDEWGTLVGFSDRGRNALILASLLGSLGVGSYAADRFLFDGSFGIEGVVESGLNTASNVLEHINLLLSIGLIGFVLVMLLFMKDWKGKSWPIYHDRN